MIYSLLLFISLTSCFSGWLVMTETQTSYQEEENHNATLEWRFSARTNRSLNSFIIHCMMFTDLKASVVFHLYEGVEDSESQDDQFAGRVQCDRDVLSEGRLRLHVSRLRINDSGLYRCQVLTGSERFSGKSRLNVSAADEPRPQRPTESPQPESRGRTGLYVGLGLTAAAGLCFTSRLCFIKSTDENGNIYVVQRSSEKQPIRTNRTLSGPPLNESPSQMSNSINGGGSEKMIHITSEAVSPSGSCDSIQHPPL